MDPKEVWEYLERFQWWGLSYACKPKTLHPVYDHELRLVMADILEDSRDLRGATALRLAGEMTSIVFGPWYYHNRQELPWQWYQYAGLSDDSNYIPSHLFTLDHTETNGLAKYASAKDAWQDLGRHLLAKPGRADALKECLQDSRKHSVRIPVVGE